MVETEAPSSPSRGADSQNSPLPLPQAVLGGNKNNDPGMGRVKASASKPGVNPTKPKKTVTGKGGGGGKKAAVAAAAASTEGGGSAMTAGTATTTAMQSTNITTTAAAAASMGNNKPRTSVPAWMYGGPTVPSNQVDSFQVALQRAKLVKPIRGQPPLAKSAPPPRSFFFQHWTPVLDQALQDAIVTCGYGNWEAVAARVGRAVGGAAGGGEQPHLHHHTIDAPACQERWLHVTNRQSLQEVHDPYAMLRRSAGSDAREKKNVTQTTTPPVTTPPANPANDTTTTTTTDSKKFKRWSREEDFALRDLIAQFGSGPQAWGEIAERMPGGGRRQNQVRDRWIYHLSPAAMQYQHGAKQRPFRLDEDLTVLRCLATEGSKWAVLQRMLQDRNDLQIRNHFNSSVRKYLRALNRSEAHLWTVPKRGQQRLLNLEQVHLPALLEALRGPQYVAEKADIDRVLPGLLDELKQRQKEALEQQDAQRQHNEIALQQQNQQRTAVGGTHRGPMPFVMQQANPHDMMTGRSLLFMSPTTMPGTRIMPMMGVGGGGGNFRGGDDGSGRPPVPTPPPVPPAIMPALNLEWGIGSSTSSHKKAKRSDDADE